MKRKNENPIQVSYLGRNVNKETFCAYVYAEDGSKKLANSWKEFERLLSEGLWFAEKPIKKETIVKIERDDKPKLKKI
jgi:hypothetical protein